MPGLSALLAPRGVAVVGASATRVTAGTAVITNLRRLNYPGAVYPVNPRYDTVEDLRCYPSMSALPPGVDVAFLGVPAEGVPPLVEEAGRCGIRAVVVTAGGFGDGGPEGAARQTALAKTAAAHRVALCGPNNMGVINWLDGAAVWIGTLTPPLRTGPVGVISQSGSVAMLCAADDRDIGLGIVISSGNEAGLDSADYLDALARDDRIRVILHFVETIHRPDAYEAAAVEAGRRGKPIAVLKVGRSARGRQATVAHTGSLAGGDEEFDAYCRHVGLLRVQTLDEALEFAEVCTKTGGPPTRTGVCMIAMSGWEVALLSDLAADADLPMADLSAQTREALSGVFPLYATIGNPLDAWGTGWNPQTYRTVIETLARDPSVGVIACAIDPDVRNGRANTPVSLDMARIHRDLLADGAAGMPRMVFFNNISASLSPVVRGALEGSGVAYLQGMSESLRAIDHWLRFHTAPSPARPRAQLRDTANTPPAPLREAMRTARGRVLGEIDTAALLTAYGIPMAQGVLARSVAEAVRHAAAIGFPVVLKAASPDLPHKSDAGGVVLNVRSAAQVRRAYRDIVERVGLAAPKAVLDGVLVAQMAPEGLEIMLGVSNGPYGPMVVAGHGGTDVEIRRDVAYARAPVDAAGALDLLRRLRVFAWFESSRGRHARDAAAVIEMIGNLSRLAEECAVWVADLDINPVIVHEAGAGAVGVDALCVLRDVPLPNPL